MVLSSAGALLIGEKQRNGHLARVPLSHPTARAHGPPVRRIRTQHHIIPRAPGAPQAPGATGSTVPVHGHATVHPAVVAPHTVGRVDAAVGTSAGGRCAVTYGRPSTW